jgi:hypothetical protein
MADKYKLYKMTVEKTFVVAAPAEQSLKEVESSANNIMLIHYDSMTNEEPTHIVAEEIKTVGDLPDKWELECLPYTNYRYVNMPEEIVNKTIKQFLNEYAAEKSNS